MVRALDDMMHLPMSVHVGRQAADVAMRANRWPHCHAQPRAAVLASRRPVS
jgi:hypothetical protein